MNQPQPEFLDLCRAGLKSAAELMKTSLESAERLQNQQLTAIQTRMAGAQLARRPLSRSRENRLEGLPHPLVVRAPPEHAVAARAAREVVLHEKNLVGNPMRDEGFVDRFERHVAVQA